MPPTRKNSCKNKQTAPPPSPTAPHIQHRTEIYIQLCLTNNSARSPPDNDGLNLQSNDKLIPPSKVIQNIDFLSSQIVKNEAGRYDCIVSGCESDCAGPGEVIRHLKTCHTNDVDRRALSWSCSICGYVDIQRSNLVTHINKHLKHFKYQCKLLRVFTNVDGVSVTRECDACTTTKATCLRHMKSVVHAEALDRGKCVKVYTNLVEDGIGQSIGTPSRHAPYHRSSRRSTIRPPGSQSASDVSSELTVRTTRRSIPDSGYTTSSSALSTLSPTPSIPNLSPSTREELETGSHSRAESQLEFDPTLFSPPSPHTPLLHLLADIAFGADRATSQPVSAPARYDPVREAVAIRNKQMRSH